MMSGDEVHVVEMSIVTVISVLNSRVPIGRVRLRVLFVNLGQRFDIVMFDAVMDACLERVEQIVILHLNVLLQLGAAVVRGVVVEVVGGVRVRVRKTSQLVLISMVSVMVVAHARE